MQRSPSFEFMRPQNESPNVHVTFNNESRMAGIVTRICHPSNVRVETGGPQVHEWRLKAWESFNKDREDENLFVVSHNLEKHIIHAFQNSNQHTEEF